MTGLIWDRAVTHRGAGLGDRHLRSLLLVHGMVTNGGPRFAAKSLAPANFEAAADACRYFGLDELAAVMLELPDAVSCTATDESCADAYRTLVPTDAVLFDAFALRFATHPEEFD